MAVKAKSNKPEQKSNWFTANNRLYPLVVFLFSFLLYANTTLNGYNLDDELVTINHPLTSQGISGLPKIFSSPFYSDNMGYSYDYRPITLASFAIEHQFFGDNPAVSHFFNALIFALLCVVLFFCLCRLFSSFGPMLPLVASLLYAAHPIHTETIASIKGRDELLSVFFALCSLWWFAKHTNGSFIKALAGGSVFFLLSLLSKISTLSFAIAIPLTLVLLLNAPLVRSLAIGLLLSLLSVSLVNLLLPQKLWFIFGTALVTTFVYVISNPTAWPLIIEKLKLLQKPFESPVMRTDSSSSLPAWLQRLQISWFSRLALPLITLGLLLASVYTLSKDLTILGNSLLILAIGPGLLLFTGWKRSALVLAGTCAVIYSLALTDAYFNFSLATVTVALVFNVMLHYRQRNYILVVALLVFIIFSWIAFQTIQFLFPVLILLGIVAPRLKFLYKYGRWLYAIIPILAVVSFPFTYSFKNLPAVINISLLLLTAFLYTRNKSRILLNALFYATFAVVLISEAAYIHYNQREEIAKEIYFETDRYLDPLAILQASNNAKGNVLIAAHKTSVATNKAVQQINTVGTKPVTGFVYDRPLDYSEAPVQISSTPAVRTATGLDIMLHYFKLVWVPYPLSFYYGYKIIDAKTFNDASVIVSLVLHLVLLFAGLFFIRKNSLVAWSIFFYLLTLAPFSNIIQTVPGGLGERYLLIPSIAFCVLLSWALVSVLPATIKSNKTIYGLPQVSFFACALLLLSYGGFTFVRNTQWKDKVTLMRRDIAYVNESAQANNLLAISLINKSFEATSVDEQHQLQIEALGHFKQALFIYPRFFNVAFDIGRTYTLLNQPDSAIQAFKYAIQLNPAYTESQMNISDLLIGQQKYTEAIPYLQEYIRYRPQEYSGYEKLSLIYFKNGQLEKSLDVNRQAAAQMPNNMAPYLNMARTFYQLNQPDSVVTYAQKALVIAPGNPDARQLLNAVKK